MNDSIETMTFDSTWLAPSLPPGYRWATPEEVEDVLAKRTENFIQVIVGGDSDGPWTDIAVPL